MNEKSLDRALAYLKSWLQFKYEDGQLPGFVVAVGYNNKVLFNEAYGYASVKTKEKLTPQHIFRIASHSKTFTATAIMQLQEQGKLDIYDPVVKYLPWLDEHKDKRWQTVTMKQIMSHSAGIIRDGIDARYWQAEKQFPDKQTFIKEILAADLVIKNGKKFKYSNYGYTLLGLAVEAVSGLSYNSYVTQNIIEYLGLANTGPEFVSVIKDRVATGYGRLEPNNTRLPIVNIDTRAMSPATGFYSNAQDLITYFSSHIQGNKKLLHDESKKEMQNVHRRVPNSPNETDYGLGFEMGKIGKRRMFGHGGGFIGHMTKTWCDPETGLIVTVLSSAVDSPVNIMAKGVIAIIDYFQKHSTQAQDDFRKFEGRFADIFSVYDVIAFDKKIVEVSPFAWDVFSSVEEFKKIDNRTLKVTKASGFASEEERIEYHFTPEGKTEHVMFHGFKMLPYDAYRLKSSKLDVIGEHMQRGN
jgi:D-alanyl-D-alanine carboxypeptidase